MARYRDAGASPTGSLTDVPGIAVGHWQRRGRGWRTGTTVVLAPPGTVGGVDVRGGGPGTRETDVLAPTATVDQVHAICLTGGSAYGLAAADGVMRWLAARGRGLRLGPAVHQVVPIVPSAVIFDLGRGGSFANRPDAAFGERAAARASTRPEANGAVGAGTGAVAGGLQGGVGSASALAPGGVRVAALAVVNAVGNVIDPATGLPWERHGHRLRRPSAAERAAIAAAAAAPAPSLNTSIGVVATSAALTKSECHRLAVAGHDGMARAIRPAHGVFDGDTVFALATGRDELRAADATTPLRAVAGRAASLDVLLDVAAQCFAVACTEAVVSARGSGGVPAYQDLCPPSGPT
jgi:L-aminopeptidase/D-esterase-like protein